MNPFPRRSRNLSIAKQHIPAAKAASPRKEMDGATAGAAATAGRGSEGGDIVLQADAAVFFLITQLERLRRSGSTLEGQGTSRRGDWMEGYHGRRGIGGGFYIYLRNTNSVGGADVTFAFGKKGDLPVVGDWDGNGTVTVGVYRPEESTFYLRNGNTTGEADVTVAFGQKLDLPVSGDWDGNGSVTIGVFSPDGAMFSLAQHTPGNAANP